MIVRLMRRRKRGLGTYHLLSRTEHKLLVELEEIESVLRLTSLGIDGLQELADNLDDFGQRGLIWVVLRRMLQHGLQEQWIPG